MNIGLYDVDSSNFPNLALMKISAYHKSLGDHVEFLNRLNHYDIVYVSKVFGDEYSTMDDTSINSDKIIYGGTGFCIDIIDGKEVFNKEKNIPLPDEIEHQYPDYSIYPELTKDKAYGFLTRGCPNDCSFCIVSKKEGRCSKKVADLSEFWNGQKEIVLCDPNILACNSRMELLKQLQDSGSTVEFNQGLDARFITTEIVLELNKIKLKNLHFAFDFMKFEKQVIKGLNIFVENTRLPKSVLERTNVYMIVNYDTTFEQDMYRAEIIKDCGLKPYVMIYRKKSAPKYLRDFQRWANNMFIFRSTEFIHYVPRKDGKTIWDLYFKNGDGLNDRKTSN